jgi:hypothetical protein
LQRDIDRYVADAAELGLQPEDTKLTTASGATFMVSERWQVARTDTLIVIQEPQRELAAAFAEVNSQIAYVRLPRTANTPLRRSQLTSWSPDRTAHVRRGRRCAAHS